VTLYHLSVKIIGRGSGRSAVGSAAYRSGEKLQSIAHAAYQSGEKIYAEGDKIIHDYTRKKGVVHSEIILPQNAPKEYADRETLWNAVEAKERRKDAQLAREVEVALQSEFTLQENIELLQKYIQENFVDRGMIADFAVHDTGSGNPHAHIMLTTRNVTLDGFGKKNRAWDARAELYNWRENWADINNYLFEEKKLNEHIDHRSYKAQGINREPTIHLGAKAWALEKMGIRTERGDYNREVKRRNAEREVRRTLKEHAIAQAVQRIEKAHAEKSAQALKEIEEYLKAEKADQIVEKLRQQREARQEAEITARHMNELKESYITLENELYELRGQEANIYTKNARILEIEEKQTAIELEYHTQKLLSETNPNIQAILQQSQQKSRPESVRERRLREQCEISLNSIADESLQKIIDNASPSIREKLVEIQNKRVIDRAQKSDAPEKTKEKELEPELY